MLIEAGGKDGRWLIYSPTEQPEHVSDWLLDLRIRAKAFREAAEELVRELNSKSGVKASLDAMLGVLPSYTALGMTSLFPHEALVYKTNDTPSPRSR